jgi:thymidylate synthase (FAD)
MRGGYEAMRIIEQSFDILEMPENALEMIEKVARTCYRSEDKICPGSAEKLVEMLIRKGHMPMIEMADATLRIFTSIGIARELERHRICSYAERSTRYVNYLTGIEFVRPIGWDEWEGFDQDLWKGAMSVAEKSYIQMIKTGNRPEIARGVLPLDTGTEFVIKGNLRQWAAMLKLRCSKHAHPYMQALMVDILRAFNYAVPIIFDDLAEQYLEGGS